MTEAAQRAGAIRGRVREVLASGMQFNSRGENFT